MIGKQLDDLIGRRGLMTPETLRMKVDEKRSFLIAADNGDIAIPTSNATQEESSLYERLLDTFHCQAFLPKLNAEGSEYCKIGHESEVPLAKQLLRHSQEGATAGFVIHGISRPGLVGKKGKLYVKGTIDFFVAATYLVVT